MNRKNLFMICIGITVAAFLLAYGLGQIWFGAVAALGVGLAGMYGWYGQDPLRSEWGVHIFWLGSVLLVTFGALLHLNAFLLVFAMVGGLGAWDLLRFHNSVADFSASEKLPQIETQHLTLLALTLLGGGILAVIVMVVRIQITYFLALVLGIFLIFALSWAIRLLQK